MEAKRRVRFVLKTTKGEQSRREPPNSLRSVRSATRQQLGSGSSDSEGGSAEEDEAKEEGEREAGGRFRQIVRISTVATNQRRAAEHRSGGSRGQRGEAIRTLLRLFQREEAARFSGDQAKAAERWPARADS